MTGWLVQYTFTLMMAAVVYADTLENLKHSFRFVSENRTYIPKLSCEYLWTRITITFITLIFVMYLNGADSDKLVSWPWRADLWFIYTVWLVSECSSCFARCATALAILYVLWLRAAESAFRSWQWLRYLTKLPAFCGSWRFITMFTRIRHRPLS
jgi:hypothetical protein